MRVILILTVLIACYITNSYTAVQVDPPTVTDSYGNYADVDSKLTFADLPSGDAYVVNPEEYSYQGLKPLFDGVHNFVKICFGSEAPIDEILGLLDGSKSFGQEFIMTLAEWGWGYALCIVIGLLFFLIFPIVGCCFCCCRCCCDNCGGKMVHKRSDKTPMWRACLIISLCISCTFLGCGIICTYVVNERITVTFPEISKTVSDNVQDFKRYADNTLMQINYVAIDGFNFSAKVMLRDIDNIGPIIGKSVQDAMNEKSKVDEAFDELLAFDPLLSDLIKGLEDVNAAKVAVNVSVDTLENSMNQVGIDIDATFASPACTGQCGTAPDTTDLKAGSEFDPDSMPSFDSELTDLRAVQANNITALVLDGRQEFNNISGIVEDKAGSVTQNIRTMVNSFDDVISDALKSVDDMLGLFDSITNLTDSIENLEETKVVGSLTVGNLERYRWMGGLGLTCFILLIFALQLIGLILGCCACCCCGDKNALPTERGSVGSCAGNFLMASVGLVFIFGSLIMLLVWITYMIGAPMEQLLCAKLKDPEYQIFKDLIDGGDPATGPHTTVLGKKDGYTLGEMVFDDSSVPLTISGLLKDCDNNAPAWEALFISKFFNISEVLDYKSTIDVNTEIDKLNVDLSDLVILDNNTKKQLNDMSTAIGKIDFDGLVASLNKKTATANFAQLAADLQTTADSIDGKTGLETVHAELLNHIKEIKRIETEDYVAVSTSQANMLDSVITLNSTASTVPSRVSILITKVDTTQTDLQTNGAVIVKNESKVFANRVLGIADQFVTFTNSTIREELGRCKPVSNFYQSVLINMMCGSILDSLNGFWFTLGWCLAFMVLGIIFSTKLAKHVRKMTTLHPDDHGNNNRYGPGKGKIHPI